MNASVPVLQTPDVSFDGGSLEFLASARWSWRMTVLLLVLAGLSWLDLVLFFSGGWASTSGAVYTASGLAMVIAASGQALVRWQAPRLSSRARGLMMAVCVSLVALTGITLPLLLS